MNFPRACRPWLLRGRCGPTLAMRGSSPGPLRAQLPGLPVEVRTLLPVAPTLPRRSLAPCYNHDSTLRAGANTKAAGGARPL